ncbi:MULTISPECIES: GGDEF domain-containing protein [Gordonia]|uniref:GGDEF domain-containing protein n=1 Tax=Gordonia tangerina TaxID=2911060 RepID=A0ABS9DM47_9ACTN|nr:GGDEF domain-containing protein [Gordonia tangerina]MCF3940166.1 GGDEF domain-containing protein [Gordonia tangerina]
MSRFDQRTLAVLASEVGAIPLLAVAYISPDFIRPGHRWCVVAIAVYTVISIVVTVAVRPLNDAQFAILSFGGMVGIAASAAVITDDGPAHAVLVLLAAIPALAAIESPPRTVVTFVLIAAGLACAVVATRAHSSTAMFVAGGAVILAILVPTYLVTTLRRSLSRALEAQATISETDPLTGVLNRRGLATRWEQALRDAVESRLPIGFIVADIDHFKMVNDRYGHSVGDATLVAVSQALSEAVPPGALVARTGGEEFVILRSVADASELHRLCDELRVHVAASTEVTVSIGAVCAAVSTTVGRPLAVTRDMVDELFAIADRQLYIVKGQGRNSVSVASTGLLSGPIVNVMSSGLTSDPDGAPAAPN